MAENSLCSECAATATHICMCKKPLKLYFCETCCGKHVFKGDEGHSIIRVQAERLVSSAEDIGVYNSSLEAKYQLSASLDSLTHQAQKEKEELQGLAWKLYEERVAELNQAYTVLWQELQAKYDQIFQELSTIKSEVTNSESRLESTLSPLTLMFIESFLHIESQTLIDCATEFGTRISVTVLPPKPTGTPLQEILGQWHCKQCQKCVKLKEKFMMKKSASPSDEVAPLGPLLQEVLPASEDLEEEEKQSWICKKCHRQQSGAPLETCRNCQSSSGREIDSQGQLPQEHFHEKQDLHEQLSQEQASHEGVRISEQVTEAKWMCKRCQFKNIFENAICWQCKSPKDADPPQCPQVLNSYYSSNPNLMDLLTVSEFARDVNATWKCPRGCGAENPMTESICGCGYVYLNLVQSTQQSEKAPDIPNPYWTCPKCSYEYNMNAADVCNNCKTVNPERSAHPQQKGIELDACNMCQSYSGRQTRKEELIPSAKQMSSPANMSKYCLGCKKYGCGIIHSSKNSDCPQCNRSLPLAPYSCSCGKVLNYSVYLLLSTMLSASSSLLSE